jgi:hypothetical protein
MTSCTIWQISVLATLAQRAAAICNQHSHPRESAMIARSFMLWIHQIGMIHLERNWHS